MMMEEVKNVIEEKAAEYGFEVTLSGMSWRVNRTKLNYIDIQITESLDDEHTDWEKGEIGMSLTACASVCRMGGNPTTEELLAAADEIARGAKFAAEIQAMNLRCTRNVKAA